MLARGLQKSNETGSDEEQGADTSGGSTAGTGRDGSGSGDGDDRRLGRSSARDGAVAAGPGGGVARTGGAESGGHIIGLGHDRSGNGSGSAAWGGGRSAAGGSNGVKATGDGVGSSASSKVHTLRAAPGVESGVLGAVVASVAGVYQVISLALRTMAMMEPVAISMGQHATLVQSGDVRSKRTARAVGAAVLLGSGIEAVSNAVVGSALVETSTASLSTGVASAAVGGLGLVAVGVAAHKAQAGHDSQAVWLGLSGSAGSEGQDGDGSSSGELHFDDLVVEENRIDSVSKGECFA